MCLFIDRTKHKSIFGNYIPKIATKKIKVIKYLNETRNGLFTPCMGVSIFWTRGKCILRGSFACIIDNKVHCGVHSCIDKYNNWKDLNLTPFEAYIPVGSLYYMGQWNEIVSTKLVILNQKL